MKKLISLVLLSSSLFAITNELSIESANEKVKPVDLLNYNAQLWFYDSVERKAIYRQVFAEGLEVISSRVEDESLKPKSWAVIFALDGTLVDEVKFRPNKYRQTRLSVNESAPPVFANNNNIATPGAVDLTCAIQKLGGNVVIISNRNAGGYGNVVSQSESELSTQGICFDSILFSHNSNDINKNPRFTAINSGDYENVITTKKLPPMNVIAYFGSDITDFPNFKQNTAIQLPDDSPIFDDFGEKYFLLPNPTRGSYSQNNYN